MKALMIVLLLLLGGCTTMNTRDCRAHAQRAIDDVFTAEMLDWNAQHGELNRETVATLRDWATLYAQEHATDCLSSRRANNGACAPSATGHRHSSKYPHGRPANC